MHIESVCSDFYGRRPWLFSPRERRQRPYSATHTVRIVSSGKMSGEGLPRQFNGRWSWQSFRTMDGTMRCPQKQSLASSQKSCGGENAVLQSCADVQRNGDGNGWSSATLIEAKTARNFTPSYRPNLSIIVIDDYTVHAEHIERTRSTARYSSNGSLLEDKAARHERQLTYGREEKLKFHTKVWNLPSNRSVDLDIRKVAYPCLFKSPNS